MKQIIVLAAVVFAVLLPVACSRTGSLPQTATPQQQVIETAAAKRQSVSSQLVLPARIVANPTATIHIYPPISGRVLSLQILPGEQVHKGQEIGTLQSSDASQARADFEKAKIEAARADLQLARAKELLAHDVMAQRDYDDLKALDESDHADLENARQRLRILGLDPNSSSDIVPILAPISGAVLDVNTGAGEMQRSLDNATAIATVANLSSVWVVGNLYPRDQAAVHLGQPATITVNGYPGLVFHGTVGNISDAVDPSTLTLQVRVVLPNPGYRLKPDMYVSMTLSGTKRDEIVVPCSAVIRDGSGAFVYVRTAPEKYSRRNVTLGEAENARCEIPQGLSDGDQVVTVGAELLRESEGR